MKYIGIFFMFVIMMPAWGESTEKTTSTYVPEVGKHVAGNMDATTMILSLLLVLVVIVASASVLKKFNLTNTSSTSPLRIITSLHLGSKEKLVVVEVGSKQLLLGVTSQQINVLETLDNPIEVNTPVNQKFTESIQKLLNKQS